MVATNQEGNLEQTKKILLPESFFGTQLYVSQNRLVIIASRSNYNLRTNNYFA